MPESHPREGSAAEGDPGRRMAGPERFAVMLAHDLRNPLAVARGWLELAIEDGDPDHLDDAMGALDRMAAIVDDYLHLAREGSMVVEQRVVDLAAVADACWQHVATGDARLVVETDRRIHADPDRLQLLLENLVRNAVEHGSTSHRPGADDAVEHGGGEVTVTVGGLEDGFYVADDGPGIPPGDRAAVLDAGVSSGTGTTGIGLAIVSAIVDAHGWDLEVTGTAGARFEITGVTFER